MTKMASRQSSPAGPVGELLKDTQDLVHKVEQAKKERELHTQKMVEESSAMNLTRQKLDDTIEEAGKNIEYFEKAKQDGLLAGEDLRKYESLKVEIEKLKGIREEVKAKAVAIYTQPGVGERIVDEAQKENTEMDEKTDKKKFLEELPSKVEGFLSEIEEMVKKEVKLAEEKQEAWDAWNKISSEIKELTPDITFGKDWKDGTPRDLFGSFLRSGDEEQFRKGL